ncbi:hypothetical protein H0H92_003901 [Tricholoma furcatifolium]|nr:hypothetical protein H0H92_003901 [Tricholoma furcatifolium]
MRHRAVPGDPKEGRSAVPMDQRVHIKIDANDSPKVLWFRKTMIAGKVLDLLAAHLKMGASSQPLQLSKFLENGGSQALQNDRPIGDQIEDGGALVVTPVN